MMKLQRLTGWFSHNSRREQMGVEEIEVEGTAAATQLRSRRGLFKLGAAAAAGATAAMLPRQFTEAADDDPVYLGQVNSATNTTEIAADVDSTAAGLSVYTPNGGSAVSAEGGTGNGFFGWSAGRFGVEGHTQNGGAGVHGRGDGAEQVGVLGFSVDGAGTTGVSTNGAGVGGFSESGAGVHGESGTGPGVIGDSDSGAGVYGHSTEGNGIEGFSDAPPQEDPPAAVFGRSLNGTGVHGETAGGNGNAVVGHSTGSGFGVLGLTDAGLAGVHGRNDNEDGRGVWGFSANDSGTGVYGQNEGIGTGVAGITMGGIGVYGEVDGPSAKAAGVAGKSPRGAGVHGSTDDGVGVYGVAHGADGVALVADGPVQFSSAGLADIPAGQKKVMVSSGVTMTAETKVLATLQSSAGNDRYITNVQKLGNDMFFVHLNEPALGNTQVAWFVIS